MFFDPTGRRVSWAREAEAFPNIFPESSHVVIRQEWTSLHPRGSPGYTARPSQPLIAMAPRPPAAPRYFRPIPRAQSRNTGRSLDPAEGLVTWAGWVQLPRHVIDARLANERGRGGARAARAAPPKLTAEAMPWKKQRSLACRAALGNGFPVLPACLRDDGAAGLTHRPLCRRLVLARPAVPPAGSPVWAPGVQHQRQKQSYM